MVNYVHVVAQYPPVIGGAQDYCAHLSQVLTQLGMPTLVYTSRLSDRNRWQNDLPEFETMDGVPVRRFAALKRGRATWRIYHWCRKQYAMNRRAILEPGLMLAEGPVSPSLPLVLIARHREFALIHLFGVYSALVWQAFIAARLVRLPIVVTPFIHTTPPNQLDMLWKKRVLQLADHIVTMTSTEKTFLEHEIGLTPEKVSVVSPGLSAEDYPIVDQAEARQKLGLPLDAFVALFIGRRDPHKGISTLIDAYRKLLDDGYTSVRLVLLGPDTSSAEPPPWRNHLGDNVLDLGMVDHTTKILALNACDCLVFPSSSESFGIVILEAWAVGKPVVAARLGSIQDTVTDTVDGLLFDVGSARQLAHALLRLLGDCDRAREMGQHGRRKFLASYTTDVMGERVHSIYDALTDSA